MAARMLNCVYRLVEPRTIEPVTLEVPLGGDRIVVRPTHLSICHADQRYYQGKRPPEVLESKLPMALIHEGVGTVVHDFGGEYAPGTPVVMIPNAPAEDDPFIAENYLRTSTFGGSTADGFMQELVVLSPSRVLPLPDGIDMRVAAFTELVSVSVHAAARFDGLAHGRRNTIGIWGDGNLGFIQSLVMRSLFPESRIVVIGRNDYKLADFTFVDDARRTTDDLSDLVIDHAFECCGGDGSVSAIEQIIGTIQPEGTVSLLGVSENPVPINTRMVLEKGLRLFGSSRSGCRDFARTLELYENNPDVVEYLESLIGVVRCVSSVADIAKAFEEDMRKPMGKTIMEWDM